MALMCKITRQSFTHAAVGRRGYGSSVRSGRGGTVCVFLFLFKQRRRLMGMQRLSGVVVAFGQVPEVAYQIAQEDGRTGGMWWLFLSLSRSRTHTHTHTRVEGIRENDCRNGFPGRQYRIVPVASLRTLVVGWTRWRSLLGVVVLGIPQVLTGWSVLGRSGGGKAGCSILSLFGVGIPQRGERERVDVAEGKKRTRQRDITELQTTFQRRS